MACVAGQKGRGGNGKKLVTTAEHGAGLRAPRLSPFLHLSVPATQTTRVDCVKVLELMS